jgi:hypothetical protein
MISKKKKQAETRGGKREGAGRPPEGKGRFTVTLDAENVKRAKRREENFSGLLDRLLDEWLTKPAKDAARPKEERAALDPTRLGKPGRRSTPSPS